MSVLAKKTLNYAGIVHVTISKFCCKMAALQWLYFDILNYDTT